MLKPLYKLTRLISVYGFKTTSALLLSRFVGRRTRIKLFDNTGNVVEVNIDKSIVSNVISLLLLLSDLDDYTLQGRTLSFYIPFYRKTISIDNFGIKDLNDIQALNLCNKNGVKLMILNDETVLAINDKESLRFIIRENSLLSDLLSGPLLFVDEPYETRWFYQILKANDVFIDIGANIGGYSVRACKIGARTIAIEPARTTTLYP